MKTLTKTRKLAAALGLMLIAGSVLAPSSFARASSFGDWQDRNVAVNRPISIDSIYEAPFGGGN